MEEFLRDWHLEENEPGREIMTPYPTGLSREEMLVLDHLSSHPKTPAQIASESGLSITDVLDALLQLRLLDRIDEVGKNYYVAL